MTEYKASMGRIKLAATRRGRGTSPIRWHVTTGPSGSSSSGRAGKRSASRRSRHSNSSPRISSPAAQSAQYKQPDIAMEDRAWPFAHGTHDTMLDVIEVDVIRMALDVPLVTNNMLPEPAPPDSSLALLCRGGDKNSSAGMARANRALMPCQRPAR